MISFRAFVLGWILLCGFGVASAASIPLAEHPRPDWHRVMWQNLNGLWRFGWSPDQLNETIRVPFGWGSPASGVSDKGDRGFYARTIVIPPSWRGKRIFVVIGACDYEAEVRLNGEVVGCHRGGYTPFACEITAALASNPEQLLEVRVWDPDPVTAREGAYLFGKQGYGNVRGIWQTVYLEARGASYLASARFSPHLESNSVTLDLELDAPATQELLVCARLGGREHLVTISPEVQKVSTEIPLVNPRRWTLDDPYLYDVTLSLSSTADGVLDEVATYFGFREIGVGHTPTGHAAITLNGECLYIQSALDQGYTANGYYTYPSDAAMRRDLQLVKDLGLNAVRFHMKVEIPAKLYWADKLGILVQADVPCAWGAPCDELFNEHGRTFDEMVARDFNHPSIYQWTLFNETWGLRTNPSLLKGQMLENGKADGPRYTRETQQRVLCVYKRAKALDPTRLIEDNSTCTGDHVATDVNSWHGYAGFYGWTERVARYVTQTEPGSPKNFVAGYQQGDQPMMNSECGSVWGYTGSTGDYDLTWDYHAMINAFRQNLKCMGFVFTQLYDVTNEWNGYVRFDRSPKYTGLEELAGMSLRDWHKNAVITFQRSTTDPIGEMCLPGEWIDMPVGCSFITEAYAGRDLRLAWSMWYYDSEGCRHETKETIDDWHFKCESWQQKVGWSIHFKVPDESAAGGVIFRMLADGEEIARNFWSFGVREGRAEGVPIAEAQWSAGSARVMDGLKVNGFGTGFFTLDLPAPNEGGVFRGEFSAKRLNAKDRPSLDKAKDGDLDNMLGGGAVERSASPNSYPQTSDEKYPAQLRIFVNDRLAKEVELPDDPADHRGILSHLSQPHNWLLHEAGSYGYLVEVPINADEVRAGRARIRLESDKGLAIYGRSFGRYPLDPHVAATAERSANEKSSPVNGK